MRSYSGRVAYGVLALVFGVASWGCSGSTDVIPTGPGTNPDAGDAGDVQPEGGDADTGTCEYTLTFAAPVDGAQLTETDDADKDFCANGFQYNVTVATNAPDGTTVSLYGNAGKIADANAAAGLVQFLNVQLPSMGSETLRVEIPQTECSRTAQVSVACSGAPECEITLPDITATHPKLNGVPVAEGGDRVSAAGSPYQVAFEVSTTVADGQPVILNVDGTVSAVSANAVGGVASFPGVTLSPDGDHTVIARCVPKVGIEGRSTQTTYAVDTQAPPLSAKKVKENAAITDLQDGDHWNPEDDADPATDGLQIRVCGTTDSASAADALDLPASLGAGQQNFCVAVGTSSPTCTPATTGGADTAGDGACVNIECPGGGPFDLTLTLRDDAGNPTVKTIQGVSCASELPQVQFQDPVGDGAPWTDINKRILAASMAGQVTRVDKDGSTTGAQYDVVGCTNASTGSARLLAGVEGAAATEIGQGTVELDAGGVCNGSGFTHIVRFSDVTLPGSQEATDGTLVHPTELTFEVTNESNATGSAKIQIWVDSKLPTLTPTDPIPLCGAVYQSATAITKDIYLGATALPVTLQVTSQGGTSQSFTESTYFLPDRVRFAALPLPLGVNELQISSTEPSGNRTTIPTAGGSCTVTVGNPPTVTWQGPVASSKLCASTTVTAGGIPDGDPVAPAWQGTLKACTNIDIAANPGATVQFSSSVTGDIGTPVTLDALGCATLNNVDISQSKALVLTAKTSLVDGLSGTASITVPVDVEPPATITSLGASLQDRRETSFSLSWTAPADNLGIAAYQVRSSKSPITSAAQFDAATPVAYTGVPAAAGSQDSVNATGLLIENDYYFGVVPVDVAGNRPSFTATVTAVHAQFNETILTPLTAGESYGTTVDGTTSINGDAYADVIVGTYRGRNAYVYFGSPSGYTNSPDLLIEGPLGGCGRNVASIGDIDADGLLDIAVFCPDQTVHIVRGRSSWPTTLTLPDDTDYLIRADSVADPKFTNSRFGSNLTRLGDFNNDGVDDFAFSAPGYDSEAGQAIIVYGSSASEWPAETSIPGSGTNFATIRSTGGNFGASIAAFATYYTPGGSTLVVSAHTTDSLTGTVYTFGGPLSGQSATTLDANHAANGNVPGGVFGFPVRILGDLGGSPASDLAIGAPNEAGGGKAYFYFGDPVNGPVSGAPSSMVDSSSPSFFGFVLLTGAFNGTAGTLSLVGDARPDIAIAARNAASGPPVAYIVDGRDVVVGGDVNSIATVTYDRFPLDWQRISTDSTTVRDVDGDGYADLAFGEASSTDPYDGRVLILW